MKKIYFLALVLLPCSVNSFSQMKPGVSQDSSEKRIAIIPPEPRLQMDIGTGSPDLQWWREANKTVDSRLAWWRDARFGCFIHWNASSMLGSEWKGKLYTGYSEHIQRMATIPCEIYRNEVVGNFNPVNFDADSWVQTIKQAGMGYIVITAKHHDGFAMYDSEVSDYNIVKATPFKRDPMAELKAACDKHGLKFGFYYSHAFDWGEPDGPGNDWDYNNPGGDKNLHGGRNWYDQHPEMVPRFRKYVDEKSLPQVLELIRKYDPDIIWFDTPHKLPPEENLRILKAARAAKPNIVINSRIVQPYVGRPHHFGDYQSTGDRAIEFPATNGDWEAIPTTNESYGYSKIDKSHKSPEFLIRVIVMAAARGGNTLLNIGPRGDGTIDPPDVNILAGIGKWMDVNGESIRGSIRTTLPVQYWGESTRKGNILYLQVFDWPKDGIIELGGYKGKVKKAWLLSDKQQSALPHKRANGVTVNIKVPLQAPDKSCSVIAVKADDAEKTSTHRLLSGKRLNSLRALDGIAIGDKLQFGDGKASRNTVWGWEDKDQKLSWPVYLNESGKYSVSLEYKVKKASNGYRIKVGEAELRSGTTGEEGQFVKQEIGRIVIPEGMHILEISPVDNPSDDFMELRAIYLKPIE